MRNRKKQLPNFYAGILTLIVFLFLVFKFPPDYSFVVSKNNIPILPIFFILIFNAFYFFSNFIFGSKRRGALIGTFVVLLLILRFNGLTNLFFAILLLIIFSGIELFFIKKR